MAQANSHSKIFALVTFAKRRLRMTELREALGISSSKSDKSLEARNMPWRQQVEKLFSPLIETQEDPKDPEDCFCLLFHSTVKAFVQDHADVLCHNDPSRSAEKITEATIGNACLRYLAQPRYAHFLRSDNGQWVTTSGQNVRDHHFLFYSAKYWVRHLDEAGESPSLHQETGKFLKSTNFMTSLQVQSLFVEGRFLIFTVDGCSSNHKWTKRVFPKWYNIQGLEGRPTMLQNYRSFIADWNDLLHCATCTTERCQSAGYGGEVDRCLFKALGPANFLSCNQGRYNDFMLTGKDGPAAKSDAPYVDGVASDGREVVVLQPPSKG